MKATTFMLCRTAEVHEGLAYIMGGGITHVWGAEFPRELWLTALLMVEVPVPYSDTGPAVVQVAVRLLDADGRVICRAPDAPIELRAPPGAVSGMLSYVMLMPFKFPNPGEYQVDALVDGSRVAVLAVHATAADPREVKL